LFDGAGRDAQRFPPRGRFNRLQVPVVARARTYERVDLGDNFGGERRREPLFFAPSCEAASGAANLVSQSCSLVSTNSRTTSRNRRYS
jgi:hypothetical protein